MPFPDQLSLKEPFGICLSNFAHDFIHLFIFSGTTCNCSPWSTGPSTPASFIPPAPFPSPAYPRPASRPASTCLRTPSSRYMVIGFCRKLIFFLGGNRKCDKSWRKTSDLEDVRIEIQGYVLCKLKWSVGGMAGEGKNEKWRYGKNLRGREERRELHQNGSKRIVWAQRQRNKC